MSLLSRILGGSFETNRADGEELFGEGYFGEAKLAYERAISKSKKETPEDIEKVRKRIGECKTNLAQAKIEEADRAASERDIEEAFSLLEEAKEICDDPSIASIVEMRRKELEKLDAGRFEEEAEEISDDKLLAIIAGTWTDDQAEEYSLMPDSFREGVLAVHDEEYGKACEIFEEIANSAELTTRPRYLWFELGSAKLKAGDKDGALNALSRFVDTAGNDRNAWSKVVAALTLKAQALSELKRDSEALDSLNKATNVNPEDHGAYLNLGVFLRGRGKNDEALEALLKASELMGTLHPDFAVVRELGFTYLALGKKKEAKAQLEAVIKQAAATNAYETIDPESAVTLAKIHEEEKNYGAAADLFRHLAVGYDTKNHFIYNLESARLLQLSGRDADLAERYLLRAGELARGESDRAQLDEIRAALER